MIASELIMFEDMIGQTLTLCENDYENYYTFEPLSKIKNYSIAGAVGLSGEIYTKTFSANPAQVLFENELTLNLETGLFVNFKTIVAQASLGIGQTRATTKNLLQAFSKPSANDRQIKTFGCFYDFQKRVFFYERLYFL
jgi:hypothetical protein